MVIGIPPAYEIMGHFSGLHMDLWGEMEMVGTIMDIDIEMVPCETIDISVPAHAEIVVEASVDLESRTDTGLAVSPSMYYLPKMSATTWLGSREFDLSKIFPNERRRR